MLHLRLFVLRVCAIFDNVVENFNMGGSLPNAVIHQKHLILLPCGSGSSLAACMYARTHTCTHTCTVESMQSVAFPDTKEKTHVLVNEPLIQGCMQPASYLTSIIRRPLISEHVRLRLKRNHIFEQLPARRAVEPAAGAIHLACKVAHSTLAARAGVRDWAIAHHYCQFDGRLVSLDHNLGAQCTMSRLKRILAVHVCVCVWLAMTLIVNADE